MMAFRLRSLPIHQVALKLTCSKTGTGSISRRLLNIASLEIENLSQVKLKRELIPVRDFSNSSNDVNGGEPEVTVKQQSIDEYLDEKKTSTTDRNSLYIDSIDRSKFTQPIPMKYPDIGGGKGKIKQWMKEEGDVVRAGDMLCDIETGMFTFGMEIDDEEVGILQEKKVKEGEEFEPGTTICVLMHEEDSTGT